MGERGWEGTSARGGEIGWEGRKRKGSEETGRGPQFEKNDPPPPVIRWLVTGLARDKLVISFCMHTAAVTYRPVCYVLSTAECVSILVDCTWCWWCTYLYNVLAVVCRGKEPESVKWVVCGTPTDVCRHSGTVGSHWRQTKVCIAASSCIQFSYMQ